MLLTELLSTWLHRVCRTSCRSFAVKIKVRTDLVSLVQKLYHSELHLIRPRLIESLETLLQYSVLKKKLYSEISW